MYQILTIPKRCASPIKQIPCPDFCNKSLFTNALRLDYVSSDHVRNLWEKQKI